MYKQEKLLEISEVADYKNRDSIPTLKLDDCSVVTDEDKANTCKGSHLFVNAVDDKYMYMYMYCMVLYYRSHGHMQGEREEVCGYWNAVPPIYTHI